MSEFLARLKPKYLFLWAFSLASVVYGQLALGGQEGPNPGPLTGKCGCCITSAQCSSDTWVCVPEPKLGPCSSGQFSNWCSESRYSYVCPE
jgi:hypothetical protein